MVASGTSKRSTWSFAKVSYVNIVARSMTNGSIVAPPRSSVLISGIGVAGPALAYWLTLYGFKATLVEKAKHLRTDGYVIDFWGRGFDVAEKMGILPSL